MGRLPLSHQQSPNMERRWCSPILEKAKCAKQSKSAVDEPAEEMNKLVVYFDVSLGDTEYEN